MNFNDFDQKPDSCPVNSEISVPLAGADSAIDLLGKAIIPEAVVLARAGKYSEAEVLLQHLIQEGASIPALFDSMARIRAQQGRLLEAQTFWAEAIRHNSSRESYQAALKCIEQLQKYPNWIRGLQRFIPVPLLIVVIILVVLAVLPLINNWQMPDIKMPTLPEQNIVNTSAVKPDITIDIPGITVNTQKNQLILTFQSGLFSQLTELRPEAKTTLDLLGKQLQPHVGKIQVNVEGHTDDMPILRQLVFKDNVSLGLQRAVTVIDYLRINCGLPAKMFKASSIGDLQALYPNDSFDNQLKNRTVVIRIVGVKE